MHKATCDAFHLSRLQKSSASTFCPSRTNTRALPFWPYTALCCPLELTSKSHRAQIANVTRPNPGSRSHGRSSLCELASETSQEKRVVSLQVAAILPLVSITVPKG
ncbi:uncharacterized protein LOC144045046 isoform X2 [Vanacampus margaritifer]